MFFFDGKSGDPNFRSPEGGGTSGKDTGWQDAFKRYERLPIGSGKGVSSFPIYFGIRIFYYKVRARGLWRLIKSAV